MNLFVNRFKHSYQKIYFTIPFLILLFREGSIQAEEIKSGLHAPPVPSYTVAQYTSKNTSPVFSSHAQHQLAEKATQSLQQGNVQAAEAMFRQALQLDASTLEAQIGLAEISEKRFEFAKARDQLKAAMAIYSPNDLNYALLEASLGGLYTRWTALAEWFPKAPQWNAQALQALHNAYQKTAAHPHVLANKAALEVNTENFAEAESSLKQLFQESPNHTYGRQVQTLLYLKTNDLARAKQSLMIAFEHDPNNPETLFLMAQLLALADRPEEALGYAQRAKIRDYGVNPSRDYFMAKQLERLGRLAESIPLYETLLARVPQREDLQLRLIALYQGNNQPEKSNALYQKYLATNPDILDKEALQGFDLLRNGQTREARVHFRKVLSLMKPSEALFDDLLHGLASAHYLDGLSKQTNIAELTQDRAFFENLSPQLNADLLIALDRIKLSIAETGQFSQEVEQQLTALSLNKNDLIAGESFFLLKQYPDAQERLEYVDGETPEDYLWIADRLRLDQELLASFTLYQRALALKPVEPTQSQIRLGTEKIQTQQAAAKKLLADGDVSYGQKQYGEAINQYTEASRLYQQWDTPYLRLGDTYEKTRRYPEAFAAFQQAVNIHPTLLSSQGFSKRFKKLQKRTQPKPLKNP